MMRVHNRVEPSGKTLLAEAAQTNADTSCSVAPCFKRGCVAALNYAVSFPASRIALVSSSAGASFNCLYVADKTVWADTAGRWMNNTVAVGFTEGGAMNVSGPSRP